MCAFFATAMHLVSDSLVSTKRMDDFFRLPEGNEGPCTEEIGPQKGEIVIRDGDYGWHATETCVNNKEKEATIAQWILSKASFLQITHCICLFADLENEDHE